MKNPFNVSDILYDPQFNQYKIQDIDDSTTITVRKDQVSAREQSCDVKKDTKGFFAVTSQGVKLRSPRLIKKAPTKKKK